RRFGSAAFFGVGGAVLRTNAVARLTNSHANLPAYLPTSSTRAAARHCRGHNHDDGDGGICHFVLDAATAIDGHAGTAECRPSRKRATNRNGGPFGGIAAYSPEQLGRSGFQFCD